MSIVTFLLLLVIAAIAAGLRVWIGGLLPPDRGRAFASCFVAYALLLTLPVLLPKLLGG